MTVLAFSLVSSVYLFSLHFYFFLSLLVGWHGAYHSSFKWYIPVEVIKDLLVLVVKREVFRVVRHMREVEECFDRVDVCKS